MGNPSRCCAVSSCIATLSLWTRAVLMQIESSFLHKFVLFLITDVPFHVACFCKPSIFLSSPPNPLISCKCCHWMEGWSICGSVCGWQMVSQRFRRNLGRLGVGLKILLWKVLTFVYSYTYSKTQTLPNGPVRKKRSESLIVNVCFGGGLKIFFWGQWRQDFQNLNFTIKL